MLVSNPEIGFMFEDLELGMSADILKTVMSNDVIGFAQISGDTNPVHLSDHFAAKTPFGGRIAHGLYTASLISALLGTQLPGPGAVYLNQTLLFRAPVRIGDVINAHVEVIDLNTEKFRAKLACQCSVDSTIVLEGEALVQVPSKTKRR